MLVRCRPFGRLVLVAALCAVAAALLASCAPTSSAPAPSSSAQAPAGGSPAWQSLPLADARTGATFSLADLRGKTVYVEPMATWCTNCRQQMGVIRDQVLARLDPDRTVLVGLSVETDLPREKLAQYVDAQGFSWKFAVMTPELLRELSGTFGQTITNPPAVPHFVVRPDGTASGLSTGFHTADRLLEELTAAGGASR
jgi:thiol-disulfide isomerase/thioredoxin